FVELASFHNFYQGKRDKNCWTEAVAILKTPSKQAYYLNLHNSAPLSLSRKTHVNFLFFAESAKVSGLLYFCNEQARYDRNIVL
ncbi:hypothetical protein ACSLN1_25805, partial [Escherichia coli]|uniref:hypothetical protein n=1 Tax=Escherichia coli TaxID=562 RepID=UPI003EE1298A